MGSEVICAIVHTALYISLAIIYRNYTAGCVIMTAPPWLGERAVPGERLVLHMTFHRMTYRPVEVRRSPWRLGQSFCAPPCRKVL